MPTYVHLINWTDQGIRNFKETVGRFEAAKAAIAQHDVSLFKQHAARSSGSGRLTATAPVSPRRTHHNIQPPLDLISRTGRPVRLKNGRSCDGATP